MNTQDIIKIKTHGRNIYDITKKIDTIVTKANITSGLCHLFCQHTSASLILCENYDNDVKIDIETFLSNLIKDGDPSFMHTIEGQDDMAAHIRTIITQTELSIPIINGQLGLGQWQGICLYEHRYQAHIRNIIISILGYPP